MWDLSSGQICLIRPDFVHMVWRGIYLSDTSWPNLTGPGFELCRILVRPRAESVDHYSELWP